MPPVNSALKYFEASSWISLAVWVGAYFASMSAVESSAFCMEALTELAWLKSMAAPTKAMIGIIVKVKMTATLPLSSSLKRRTRRASCEAIGFIIGTTVGYECCR